MRSTSLGVQQSGFTPHTHTHKHTHIDAMQSARVEDKYHVSCCPQRQFHMDTVYASGYLPFW